MRNFIIRRLIGIFEVAGGVYGVASTLRGLFAGLHAHGVGDLLRYLFTTGDALRALIELMLYGLALVAGVLLLEGDQRGVRLSRWAQLLQWPQIVTPWLSYGWYSGAFVSVVIPLQSSPYPLLDWGVGSERLWLGHGVASWQLGINLLALLSWLELRRALRTG